MATFIHQYVALTGFDLEAFEDILGGLARVHCLFKDLLPANKLENLEYVSDTGYATLTCHTRYFTSRCSCYSPIVDNFGPDVDPNGNLEKLKGNNFVHTEDMEKTRTGNNFTQKGNSIMTTGNHH